MNMIDERLALTLCGEVVMPDEPPAGPPTLREIMGRVGEVARSERAAVGRAHDVIDAGEPSELLVRLLRAVGSAVTLPAVRV